MLNGKEEGRVKEGMEPDQQPHQPVPQRVSCAHVISTKGEEAPETWITLALSLKM